MPPDHDDYAIRHDPASATIVCTGVMRLNAAEYTSIGEALARAAEASPTSLTLDLRGLTALNSSGITLFARFILSLRKRADLSVRVLGSSQVPWQPKSLANFKLLLPNLRLDWEE